MVDLEIRDARPHELSVAAAVLSRGMRDNPLHLSVFGPEPEEREKKIFGTPNWFMWREAK
jgi:hypothetical protein